MRSGAASEYSVAFGNCLGDWLLKLDVRNYFLYGLVTKCDEHFQTQLMQNSPAF